MNAEESHRLRLRLGASERKVEYLEQRLKYLEDFLAPQIKAFKEQEIHEQKLFEEQMYKKN